MGEQHMKVPIELSRVLDRGGNPTVRELLSSIVFNPSNGTISLNGARIVMQRTAVSTELRRELIHLLGPHEARVFLMRLGYLSGQADARFVRASWPNLDARDAFTAGTRLHTFSGVVRVETVFNTYDFRKKKLTAEFIWHDSVEAAEFQGRRPSPDPVCWTQLGYASGYASEFFDTLIVYKETECAGQGHSHCRVIGKHADGWGAGDPDVALFRDRIVTSQNAAPENAPHIPGDALVERALSDLDRALLAPVRPQLDRLAPMALPVLIAGAPGTGRGRAAQYLHRASANRTAKMRRIFGSQVDHMLCEEIAKPGKAGKRSVGRDTVMIDGLEDVPTQIQPLLARSIEDGVINAGPRVIALSEEDRPAGSPIMSPELQSAYAGLAIRMPRFSERAGQLGMIANVLLPMLASRMGMESPKLDDAAMRHVEAHSWPGNLHQMRSVLTAVLAAHSSQAPIGAREIDNQLAGIPLSINEPGNTDARLSDLVDGLMEVREFRLLDLEQSIYQAALERAGGNLSAAARVLGLTRAQFAYRVKGQGDAGQAPAPAPPAE
jgi:predicted hydrocarbon binding protein